MGDPLDWLIGDWADAVARAGRAGGRGPLPAAVRGDRRGHRLGPDRRGRDAGPHARRRWAVDPRVVPLPELRLPAAGRRRHRQDVVRDPARGDPDLRPPRSRACRCRSPAGRTPSGPVGRSSRPGRSSTCGSRAASRATSSGSGAAAGRSRSEPSASAAQPVIDRARAHPRRRRRGRRDRRGGADRADLSERVTVASERLAGRPRRRAASRSTRRSRRAWAPTARRSTWTSRAGPPSRPRTRRRSARSSTGPGPGSRPSRRSARRRSGPGWPLPRVEPRDTRRPASATARAAEPTTRYSIVRTFSNGWPSASGPIVE